MPVVIAGLILSFLVMMLFGGTELDRTLLHLLAMPDAPRLRAAAGWIVAAATPLPLFLIALAAAIPLAVFMRWREALLLVATVAVGQALVSLIQSVADAVRPAVAGQPLATGAALYPSGTAANATITGFALAFLVARRFPARAWALAAAVALALAAGLSQLVIGGSWPSDIIGGWALGLAWTLLILLLARIDLGDGTARPLRHSPGKERQMSENPRTETARRNDDKDLIESQERAPDFVASSGGNLQRDVGTRAEIEHETLGKPGTEGVRDKDKSEGDTNLPRYNER